MPDEPTKAEGELPKVTPKANGFAWTEESIQAAIDVAADELTVDEIAEKAGVVRKTLFNWRKNPEFSAQVEEYVSEIKTAIRRRGIAVLERRVGFLQNRHDKMCRVIEARAADPEMKKAAGGDTGLLVRRYKSVGSGANAEIVEEFEVDTGILKELREHEQQAAKELGQWTDRQDHTTGGKPFIIKTLRGVTADALK